VSGEWAAMFVEGVSRKIVSKIPTGWGDTNIFERTFLRLATEKVIVLQPGPA
jgi:hypothetical protein